jgi:tRNA(Ile2) C34 agmatinyltransferase TiaS
MGDSVGEGRKMKSSATKKCPYCNSHVKSDAVRCDVCRRRIGVADAYGVAKKPVNIGSYVVALGAVAALVGYLIWAFGG